MLYLNGIANVDRQCSRDGLYIHPLIIMLHLQPSHLVLQQHSQPWIQGRSQEFLLGGAKIKLSFWFNEKLKVQYIYNTSLLIKFSCRCNYIALKNQNTNKLIDHLSILSLFFFFFWVSHIFLKIHKSIIFIEIKYKYTTKLQKKKKKKLVFLNICLALNKKTLC